MRIKRFEAKDMPTAMALVKEEMGDDAVILATRTLKNTAGGAAGLRPRVEVVAARDYDIETVIDQAEPAPAETAKAPETNLYDYRAVRRPAAPTVQAPPKEETATPASRRSEARELRLRFANLLRGPGSGRREKQQKAPADAKKSGPLPEEVIRWRDQVISRLRLAVPAAGDAPLTLALVGATGVGKTTTAAKLAAWYRLREGRSVALVSMDCYRIGATDQLRTYARIMRLPCEVALRKEDLRRSLDRHRDKDIIIIDTAGKSPYDETHVPELREWFADCPEISPQLVISATAKKEDLARTIDAYAELPAGGLILSKLDETRAYATLCRQAVASKMPITYISTGQRVPEDFRPADKSYLDTLFKQGWEAANKEAPAP